jgi:alkanesulfonate monooxygenase SsuD/methylene tetrahydromethanopterin reductase-like flavin-dependent oxidoreductase (luciferase family)
MKIGFLLANFGTSYAHLRNMTIRLDQLGYDSAWVWDHYVSWNDPHEAVLEAFGVLPALAEATKRIRLGPLVANVINRHPARLAKLAATLSDVTHGRFELGIGAGGYEQEQAPFGIAVPPPAERVERVAEALQIVRALWSGEPVTFEGQYYQLHGAFCSPAPSPAPRLIVGASGPRLARIAGRYADGLNLQLRDAPRFAELITALDTGLADTRRTRAGFDLSLHLSWRDIWQTDIAARLETWAAQGFTRLIAHISDPFPIHEIEDLARQLGL